MTKVEWGLQLYRGEISVRELRSMFPAGPGNNTVVFPGDPRSLCIAESIWVPPRSGGEREHWACLLDNVWPNGWKSYEPTERRTIFAQHLIHHFIGRANGSAHYRVLSESRRFGTLVQLRRYVRDLGHLKPYGQVLYGSSVWGNSIRG